MSQKPPGSVNEIREERFVETEGEAVEVLSKDESDRIREQAKRSLWDNNPTTSSDFDGVTAASLSPETGKSVTGLPLFSLKG